MGWEQQRRRRRRRRWQRGCCAAAAPGAGPGAASGGSRWAALAGGGARQPAGAGARRGLRGWREGAQRALGERVGGQRRRRCAGCGGGRGRLGRGAARPVECQLAGVAGAGAAAQWRQRRWRRASPHGAVPAGLPRQRWLRGQPAPARPCRGRRSRSAARVHPASGRQLLCSLAFGRQRQRRAHCARQRSSSAVRRHPWPRQLPRHPCRAARAAVAQGQSQRARAGAH